jgi:hypothetical protein
MTKILSGIVAFMFAMISSHATNYLTVDFGTGYTNGNLAGTLKDAAGQNGWKQTSTNSPTPVQINTNGKAVIGASGQDVYKAFTTPFTRTDGNSIYLKSRFALTSSTTNGDYFIHLTPTAGDSFSLFGRIGAKLTATNTNTYLLGVQSISGTNAAMTYGTNSLNLGTFYDVVMKWDFKPGPTNDTFSLYVDPTNNVLTNLSSYASANWLSTTSENTNLAAVNLRQGSSSNNTTALISSLSVGDSLSDVGVIPEPSSSMLMAFGAAGLIGLLSLRRKQRKFTAAPEGGGEASPSKDEDRSYRTNRTYGRKEC